jgi:hypothetical protein
MNGILIGGPYCNGLTTATADAASAKAFAMPTRIAAEKVATLRKKSR